MIHLFNAKTPKNDLITFNGEYILDNICSKGIITEELNGEYSFEGIFRISNSIDKKAYDLLIEDSLLKIDDEYGEEYFRIASIDKTKYEIEVYARHITISDILTMWCEDVRPESQNGNGAINWIFDNAKGVNNFQVSSNISDVSTAYYNNKTVYEALFTADNSFLDRWGGEVYRRGFNIAINSKVGADRGVSIRSRKNLLGFEASTNLNELTTRIYPKGFDGITIEEKYIDSELINNYARVYSREIKFDDVRVNDDYYFEGFETLEQAQEELKRRCDQQFKINKIDIINATYRIDFVELSKTEEYKDYSIVERTWIGDTVNVIEENLDIDINVRVVKRQYDIKKKKRINTELSNKDTKIKPPTIGDIITEIEKIPSTENILQQAKDQATAIINAGMKNSYVVVRKNEILIMDTEDINTAIKVWRWNNGGLGYSSTGYFGQYGTAITNDGSIVADFITVGILNADLIKAGSITSLNGSIRMNIEEDFFEVSHNLGATKTRIDEEGFYILDSENETIASLASKESWSELKANKVFADNIDNVYTGDANLYVNHSKSTVGDGSIENPFSNFDELMALLNKTKIINKSIVINILSEGDVVDRLSLNGFRGFGYIEINLNKNLVLQASNSGNNSGIYITYCDKVFIINGGRTSYNSDDGAILNSFNIGVECYYTKMVKVRNLNANCKSYGCYFYNTGFYTRRNDFCDTPTGIFADNCAVGFDADSVGNCSIAYYSKEGSVISYGSKGEGGYTPLGTRYEHSGVIHELNTRTATGSYRTKPVVPSTNTYYKDFSYTSLGTYQYKWSNWSSGECKSGVYSSYGDKAGHIFFDVSAIRSFISNGTVLDGNSITLTRANSGGASGGVSIYVGGSSCSSASGTPNYYYKAYVGTLAWGETKTFTLPKNIVEGIKSGIINSITTHSSAYSNIVSSSVNIKVQK